MSENLLDELRQKERFRQSVIEIVELIPHGKVLSYGDVATLAGSARAARAVGAILKTGGHDLPWHRVINGRMGISGSYADGRPLMQVQLLQNEGHRILHNGLLEQGQTARWSLVDALEAWNELRGISDDKD